MKTISVKTAFITASVIAFLALGSSSAQAQWRSDRNSNDRSFRERIEDKLDKERDNRRDEHWDRSDRRDEKFNNGRFGRNRRFDRDDCCRNCKHKHDNRFERRQERRHDRRRH